MVRFLVLSKEGIGVSLFDVAFVHNLAIREGVFMRNNGRNLFRNVVFQGSFGKVFYDLGTISFVVEEES
jgi:hypothetical protein